MPFSAQTPPLAYLPPVLTCCSPALLPLNPLLNTLQKLPLAFDASADADDDTLTLHVHAPSGEESCYTDSGEWPTERPAGVLDWLLVSHQGPHLPLFVWQLTWLLGSPPVSAQAALACMSAAAVHSQQGRPASALRQCLRPTSPSPSFPSPYSVHCPSPG